MRAVVQRCDSAEVVVAGEQVGGFTGPGLTVLLGIRRGDTREQATKLAEKIWRLRIFPPDRYPEMNCAPPGSSSELSAADLELPVLVVSHFTLYGRTDKGRRPTWEDAAGGAEAEPLVTEFVAQLRGVGATVSTGVFGADMRVSLTNDGPITLIVEV